MFAEAGGHRREIPRLRAPAFVAGGATNGGGNPAHCAPFLRQGRRNDSYRQRGCPYNVTICGGGRSEQRPYELARLRRWRKASGTCLRGTMGIEERFLDCVRRRLSQEARQTEEETGALRSLPASGQAE